MAGPTIGNIAPIMAVVIEATHRRPETVDEASEFIATHLLPQRSYNRAEAPADARQALERTAGLGRSG
ncbi:MAG: hypothetical protein ACR2MN_13995 [Acidimicrobiales bacterium]